MSSLVVQGLVLATALNASAATVHKPAHPQEATGPSVSQDGDYTAFVDKENFTPPQRQYIITKTGKGETTFITVDCARKDLRIEKKGVGTDKDGHELSAFHQTSYDMTDNKYTGETSIGYWKEIGLMSPVIVTNGLHATSQIIPADDLCSGIAPLPVDKVPYARIMNTTKFETLKR